MRQDRSMTGLGRDPGPRRAREQPARHQPRHPEAQADRLHRRVRIGEELARVRDDRGRVASASSTRRTPRSCRASWRRRPAGRRLAREPDARRSSWTRSGWAPTRARPSARRPTPTTCSASSSAASAQPHIGPSSAFSFNVPAGTISGEITLERGKSRPKTREITITGGMCAECEGLGRVSTVDIDAARGPRQEPQRGRHHVPGLPAPAPGTTASSPTPASSTPTSRCATSPMPSGSASSTAPRRRSRPSGQPHLRGARRQDPQRVPRQGPRLAPAEPPRGRRARSRPSRPARRAAAPG